jgi:hypothetical protein
MNQPKKDYYLEHYKQLKDMVVYDIIKDDEGINGEPLYGIVFRGLPSRGWPANKVRVAWIQMDAEGNGAGHLNIQDTVIKK